MKTLALVFILLLAGPAFAQNPSDKLSPAEQHEAQTLARTFARRLLRTKDLGPLIDEYFVSDFLSGYLRDKDQEWFLCLKQDVAAQVSRAELRRYFIAELNWFYMGELYVFSRNSSRSVSNIPPDKLYPADVLKVLRSDPRMRATLDETGTDDSKLMIGSVKEFTTFRQKLERVTRLLRKHARTINAGHTPQYRETISDWTDRYSLYDPWLSVCEQACLTQPKGTRLIVINIPSIQLQLARVNGRMRIVSAWFLID
jgi:hypothetical protein